MKVSRFDHITDAELLHRYAVDKNGEWIGILLERYTLLLLGVCMKYLKNEEEAKDAVQQIFLKVLTDADRYRIDYFKSWLYTVAKNHCLMKLRAKSGKQANELTEQMATVAEDPGRGNHYDEKTYTLLEEALHELNAEQQRCVTLFYLQKASYGQISERTGYTLMQVKSYIQNGKRNLKRLLDKKLNKPSGNEP